MSLTLVGDPCQSIYSWRGAKPDLFLNYIKLFPGKVSQHTIVKNYRTPKQLVELANEFRLLFEENGVAKSSSVPHLSEMPNVLEIKEFETQEQEIYAILKEIKELHTAQKIPYSKINILCRRNEDLTNFESGLVSFGIPYYFKFDSQSLMQKSAFKFLYSLYTLALDPYNILSFCEIIAPIKGIGAKFLERLNGSYNNRVSVLDFFSKKENLPDSKQSSTVLQFISHILEPFVSNVVRKELPLPALNRTLLQTLNVHLSFEEDENNEPAKIKFDLKRKQLIDTLNTIFMLYKVACEDERFQKLSPKAQFEEVYENLQLSQDNYKEAEGQVLVEESKNRDALGLYTIHSFKGKENDFIYYAMIHGLKQIDFYDFENRCVFYVAITRSRRKLTLSGSKLIKSYGNSYLVRSFENPFLRYMIELAEKY